MDYSAWKTKLKEWEHRLETEDLEKDDKWLLTSMSKLIRMAVECDQDYIPSEGYIKCSRVIKLRKYIPNYIFTALSVDKILLSGVYIKMEGVLISKDYADKYLKSGNKFNERASQEFSDYYMPTIADIGDGNYFILKKSDLAEYILYGRNYSLFHLNEGALF